MKDILTKIAAEQTRLGITLYPGVSDEQITSFQQKTNRHLPQDFRALYQFTDGFLSEEDHFRIIPLQEMEIGIVNCSNNHLEFAEYHSHCDTWWMETTEGGAEYTIKVARFNGHVITLCHSLEEFLRRFIKGGVFEKDGLYDWAEELDK